MAAEFAMVIPLFLLVVFGIIDAGRAFWAWNALEYAIENTARHALVNPNATEAELQDHAQEVMAGMHPDTAGLLVSVTPSTVSGVDMVKVSGTYTFTPVLPLPGSWDSFQLSADAQLAVP
jgi:Flp pilus assembly protein TadG